MTEQDKHTNIAVGMRVKLRDSDYPGHGTVTMLHPPDDRPAYTGQTWFEVRWDDWGGDEGAESDHRDTDLAPIPEPEQACNRGNMGAPIVEPERATCNNANCGGCWECGDKQPRSPQRRIAEQAASLAHDCNRARCNDCVEHGGTVERARIRQIIEAYQDKPCPAQGHDERWCARCSTVEDVLDDLLAALDEGANDE